MQPLGPMRLDVLLPAEKILLLPASNKKEILQELVRTACPAVSLPEADALAAQIEKREESISTVLPCGIALPHMRVEDIGEIKAALALFKKPVLFSGGKKVRALFLFLSPADPSFFSSHLQLVSACAQTFTTEFVHKLTSCHNAQEAAALFK